MSLQDLKEIMARLDQELETTELDEEALQQINSLRAHLEETVEEHTVSDSPMMQTAKALETRFAAEHPVAEKVIRELMDTLVRMGV